MMTRHRHHTAVTTGLVITRHIGVLERRSDGDIVGDVATRCEGVHTGAGAGTMHE